MVEYKVNPKCLQGVNPYMVEACCKGNACEKCGFNIDVHNERVRRINNEGLTLCEDGLRRLVIGG